jgi:hypothetical protein
MATPIRLKIPHEKAWESRGSVLDRATPAGPAEPVTWVRRLKYDQTLSASRQRRRSGNLVAFALSILLPRAASCRNHNSMRKSALTVLGAVVLALAAFCVPAQSAESNEPKPYTRIVKPDTNTTELQISVRKFVPVQGAGPTIWLAAVMHVGDPSYYKKLQQFLEKQSVVLYEGINPDAHPHHVHEADLQLTNAPMAKDTNGNSSMQTVLAHSLGLVFQLDAIDYDRTNFLNSDLSIEQIQTIMAGGRPLVDADTKGAQSSPFNVLLQIMDGSSFIGSIFQAGLKFIGDNPQLQAVAKLTLIESIGRLEGNLSDVQGLPPEWKNLLKVLIEARNQNLIKDLKEEMAKLPADGSVAVFYGAGHMDNMQKNITAALHYRPAGDIWMTAFSVDMSRTGLSPFEAQWMGNIIDQQMKDLRTPVTTNR